MPRKTHPDTPVATGSDALLATQVTMPLESAAARNHPTSRQAIEVLLADNSGFVQPSRNQRQQLQVAFARQGKALIPSAYDIVRLSRPVDLDDNEDILANIDAILIYEIKSTNRANVDEDLKGYFFNITGSEMLVAQQLGSRFRIVFVHTVKNHWQEMAPAVILAAALARSIQPSISDSRSLKL